MRILLDENLDWRLRRDLPGHETESVPLIGWAGIQNGELLTRDSKCSSPWIVIWSISRISGAIAIAMIALRAKSNRLDDTRPLMKQVLALLPQSKAGKVTFIPDA